MSTEDSQSKSGRRTEEFGADDTAARGSVHQNGSHDSTQGQDRVDPLADDDLGEESDPDGALNQLKELILGPERVQLGELRELIESSQVGTDELSQMLPQAVWQAAGRDEKLAAAMSPIMADSFQDSVRRNPKALADAISPIMGPAIRQSIRQAISGMVQSLNQTVEHSFSWNGLKWRWQAFQTGRPFAEVVLLNAFVYRVEQMFLIHREDGSLLAHAATGASGADVDLVSGMLTAIQDFVRQSFGGSEEDSVESMRVGDHHVWIIGSPHAFLAAVIRGVPPSMLRRQLRGEMEAIHEEMSAALTEYSGDNSPFEMVVPRLESCLQSEVRAQERTQPAWIKKAITAGVLLVPLLLLGTLAVWGTQRWRAASQTKRVLTALQLPASATATFQDGVAKISGSAPDAWLRQTTDAANSIPEIESIDVSEVANADASWLAFVQLLRTQPGIVVAESAIDSGQYVLSGLRDPQATDPRELLRQFDLDPSKVATHFESFASTEPTFVLKRLLRQAPAANGVSWQVEGERLVASGCADKGWFTKAGRFAEMARPTVVDVDQVVDSSTDELAELIARIDGETVTFKKDSSQILKPQKHKLEKLAVQIVELQEAAQATGRSLNCVVVGHMDPSIDRSESRLLPKERAERVRVQLVSSGVRKETLKFRVGSNSVPGESATPRTYCVIHVEESP